MSYLYHIASRSRGINKYRINKQTTIFAIIIEFKWFVFGIRLNGYSERFIINFLNSKHTLIDKGKSNTNEFKKYVDLPEFCKHFGVFFMAN
jgi:hypothetical protein